MKAPFAELLELGVKEKLQIIWRLWDSICDSSAPITMPDELVEELDRRKAAHKRNPNAAISWEEAKERIRSRHA